MGQNTDVSPRKRAKIEIFLKETNKTHYKIALEVGVSRVYVTKLAGKLRKNKYYPRNARDNAAEKGSLRAFSPAPNSRRRTQF